MNTKSLRFGLRVGWVLFLLALVACQSPLAAPVPTATSGPEGQATAGPVAPPVVATPTPRPLTQVTFRVHLPENTPIHQGIFLTQVDEITGLPVTPERAVMKALNDRVYEVTLTVPLGSVLTYRYERKTPEGAFVQEHRWDGAPVRYRVVRAFGPTLVEDVVARWTDTPYVGPPPGRLQGRILNASTGEPVPHALIFVGGYQMLSNALGEFLVEGLPPGVHNVVVMDLNGDYRLFQQLAEVASQATTPAEIPLQPAPQVEVRFEVYPPRETPRGAPIRLVGHWYRLGNTFGDLRGGLSTVASRAPQLHLEEDGHYTLTLSLPAGEELRYKFTLGDGLLNAELDPQGRFVSRRLMVPEQGARVVVQIARWSRPNVGPVWFEVTVPESTPPEDLISLQLAYNTWGEPLPMWYLGGNRWGYMFYGPLPEAGGVTYRYCRNEQCEVAPEVETQGRRLQASTLPQRMVDEVKAWANYASPQPLALVNPAPEPRGEDFLPGLAWTPGYHPAWYLYEVRSLRDMARAGARVAVFQPTWAALQSSPYPVFAPEPGHDALAPDVARWLEQARGQGLQPWLFPRMRYPNTVQAWWQEAPRDYPWWVAWFERYRAFLLHHAVLAQRYQGAGLVVGGWEGWISFPERPVAEGMPSGAPLDAEQRWVRLLQEARSLYSGPLYWAVVDDGDLQVPEGIAQEVDGFLLLWQPPVATQAQVEDVNQLQALYAEDFRTRVAPWARQAGKPVVVGLRFPAAQGALQGCIRGRERGEGCLTPEELLPPQGLNRAYLDLEAQWKGLQAALVALNGKNWLQGVVVFAWYPPVEAQEPSESIHGKPAQQVVTQWFQGWRGQTP